jgi:hypothetical protein
VNDETRDVRLTAKLLTELGACREGAKRAIAQIEMEAFEGGPLFGYGLDRKADGLNLAMDVTWAAILNSSVCLHWYAEQFRSHDGADITAVRRVLLSAVGDWSQRDHKLEQITGGWIDPLTNLGEVGLMHRIGELADEPRDHNRPEFQLLVTYIRRVWDALARGDATSGMYTTIAAIRVEPVLYNYRFAGKFHMANRATRTLREVTLERLPWWLARIETERRLAG